MTEFIKGRIFFSPWPENLTESWQHCFQAWKQGILQRAVDAGFLQYAKFLQAPNHA
jgi:hypothetical protein